MSKPVQHIGIIGEGKMGTNIFYYLLDFGFSLTWITSENADLEKLGKNFRKKLKRSLDAGILDQEKHEKMVSDTIITREISALAGCDLIIEAIPEDLRIKQNLFCKIDAIVNPGCIFATNSSSIKPSMIMTSLKRKEKFIGLHFFYPVSLKNVVEVIRTGETSEETLDRIAQFLDTIHRNGLQLDEETGFILNKIFLAFQNEAFLIVQEGQLSFRQIDNLVKNLFFPFGVFDFMESVGFATMLASIRNYTGDYDDKQRYTTLLSFLDHLMAEGKSSFYIAEDETSDPEPTTVREIASRLAGSLHVSLKHFTNKSGLPEKQIHVALNEYFDTDISLIPRGIPA